MEKELISCFYGNFVEGAKEVIYLVVGFLVKAGVDDGFAFVHHNETSTVVDGETEVVGNHDGSDLLFFDDFVGEFHDVVGCFGVESCCVFVED